MLLQPIRFTHVLKKFQYKFKHLIAFGNFYFVYLKKLESADEQSKIVQGIFEAVTQNTCTKRKCFSNDSQDDSDDPFCAGSDSDATQADMEMEEPHKSASVHSTNIPVPNLPAAVTGEKQSVHSSAT